MIIDCHVVYSYAYTYTWRIHFDTIMKTSEDFFKKNIPLTLFERVVCVRGSWRPNRTATYWPPLLWPSALCLSRSPDALAFLYAIDKLSTFQSHKGWGKNDSSVYFDFDCLWNASPISHIPIELAKGCTHFCESGVYPITQDDRLREGAAEDCELFYHLQSLSLVDDVGLNIWFSRWWLVHHFCLFCSDG